MIKLRCPCSKTLEIPDQLAGQKIKCKGCGKVLSVPAAGASSGNHKPVTAPDASSPFFIEGYRPCPQCGKAFPRDVKICVACGMDIDSGAMLYASLEGGGDASREVARPARGFLPRLLAMLGLGGKKGKP